MGKAYITEERIAREPKLFGIRVTLAVYAVCFVHLILCIATLHKLVVGAEIHLQGVVVSGQAQWWYGMLTCFSIAALISCSVGTLYLMNTHLTVYANFMLFFALVDFVIFVVFLGFGRSCQSTHVHSAFHMVATIFCGIQDVAVLFGLAALVLFKLLCVFITRKARNFMVWEVNDLLMPFVQAHVKNISHAQRVADIEEEEELKQHHAHHAAHSEGQGDDQLARNCNTKVMGFEDMRGNTMTPDAPDVVFNALDVGGGYGATV